LIEALDVALKEKKTGRTDPLDEALSLAIQSVPLKSKDEQLTHFLV
jgi:hypothetical protein